MTDFEALFRRATGLNPYPYQRNLASLPIRDRIIHIPTGAGKTAAVILSWLYRLHSRCADAPRRMIYCLPVRVLVEQTAARARQWINALGIDINVSLLMGGEIQSDWESAPERPALIIGTQDMLLSRALNRGYGMNRYRWPLHFALLNNDCLWVCDEVQLMGDGLATSAQMAAFRRNFLTFGSCPCIWMSATIDSASLTTVDLPCPPEVFSLGADDLGLPELAARLQASKSIEKAPEECLSAEGLAKFLLARHRPGTQTIAVMNTVARAQELFSALKKFRTHNVASHLLHSRFRPAERRHWRDLLESPVPDLGRILVSTQVIEAGVDVSSALLVTDLAPWPSLVQRFGRCNRKGEFAEASIFWIDRTSEPQPYDSFELAEAAEILSSLKTASPYLLPRLQLTREPQHVLRRCDLLDLFDTSPDISGNDIDVSRFVRSEADTDVFLAWRANAPQAAGDAPAPDELCQVPIGDMRNFLKKKKAWKWDILEGLWKEVSPEALRPGMVFITLAEFGGYDSLRGLDFKSARVVEPVSPVPSSEEDDGADPGASVAYTQTLAAHSREVRDAMLRLLDALDLQDFRRHLLDAALYHDWGKAHPIFQQTINPYGLPVLLAKSPTKARHARKHFRHELAAAIALLQTGAPDLTAYLVAAHHGKVRVSIRALPGEDRPDDSDCKFARGIFDGDILPSVNLNGETKPAVRLDLEPLLLGRSMNGSPSWTERALSLRDKLGPFRLAYLEALLIAADIQASSNPKEVL